MLESLRRNAKIRHSRYMQVATVRPDGRPANRTVVYRGLLQEAGQNSDRVTFVTDRRSNKVVELDSCPWAEIAWYFPDTREQYRMMGTITVVDEDLEDEALQRARLSAWKNMSDPGRQQFLWPHPGLPRPEDGASEQDTLTGASQLNSNIDKHDSGSFNAPAPTKDDPVAAPFCLCIVDIVEVDHLDLKANERRKWVCDSDTGVWKEEYLNP